MNTALAHSENSYPGDIILLPEGATRADAIVALTKLIPQNEFKLPTAFYRSDFLPSIETGELLTAENSEVAMVPLSFEEGYPTYNEGRIWWFQLPAEPLGPYILFQRFLEQAETEGLRQLQLLSQQHNIPLHQIAEYSKEFYWTQRARAYDLFQLAADRKRRVSRQRRIENAHFENADALLQQLMQRFSNQDWVKELDAAEAINALSQLVKIQRMSAGLSANGNMGNEQIDPMAAATGSDLLKVITRGTDQGGEALGINNNLAELLKDPNFARNAQALILQVRSNGSAQIIDAEFNEVAPERTQPQRDAADEVTGMVPE